MNIGRCFRTAGNVSLCLALCFLLSLAGCAAGTGPGGEVVVGWDVARLPETAEQSAVAIADLLLPGLGTAGAGILGAIGLAVRNGAKRREAEREAARLAGANDGWDERERAAATQQPLGGVPLSAGGGAGASPESGAAA